VLRWVHCSVDITDVVEMREVLERIRKAIEKEQTSGEGRPIAMRIRLEGATRISNELAAHPEWLEHQIKALGAEFAGHDLWIERVENAVTGKLDLESTLADDTALGKLLKEILDTPGNAEEIDGLDRVLADLRQKMPEAFGPDSILNLDEEQTVQRLVEEAKHMVVGRLLTVGGPK
jgi:hypothetical protein